MGTVPPLHLHHNDELHKFSAISTRDTVDIIICRLNKGYCCLALLNLLPNVLYTIARKQLLFGGGLYVQKKHHFCIYTCFASVCTFNIKAMSLNHENISDERPNSAS